MSAGAVAVGTPEEEWRAGLTGTPLPAPCRFCDYGLFCRVDAAGHSGRSPAPVAAASAS